MNKMSVQYRQGDVLILKADEIPKGAKHKKSDIIVEGEATGHAHRIKNGQILISKEKDLEYPFNEHETMWIKAFKNAQVVHEEHGLINLEVGFYMIVRQREWDDEKERLVLD